MAMYSMRSAFKRWLVLHGEQSRTMGNFRIPYWFRYYIRQNTVWTYTVADEQIDCWCNRREMDYDERRRYAGNYSFSVSDEELLNLERPKEIC